MKHREIAIAKAIQAIRQEHEFTLSQIQSIENYLTYLYDIGRTEGKRQIIQSHQKPVKAFKNGETKMVFRSVREAARHIGVTQQNLSIVLAGKRNSAKGYYWRFITWEEYEQFKTKDL